MKMGDPIRQPGHSPFSSFMALVPASISVWDWFKEVQKALSELEHQFLQDLDLLKRGIISEPEFVKANEAARSRWEHWSL